MSKLRLLERFGDGSHAPCWYCGGTLAYATLERDRVIPGGPYADANLRPAGARCNRERSNKRS